MEDRTPCQRLSDLVAAAPERAASLPSDLGEHASGCPACQADLHASSRLVEALRDLGATVEPATTPALLVARATLAAQPLRTSFSPLLRVVAPLAALLLLGVAGLLLLTPERRRPTAKSPPARLEVVSCQPLGAGATASPCGPEGALRTGPGQRARIQLSDGTTLWLNHHTSARLVAGHPRGLSLDEGEVFLDVTRQGPDRPALEVRLPTGQVRVVGTRLVITARAAQAVVGVLAGKVEVSSGGAHQALPAGGEAILTSDQAPLVRAAADLGLATEWASATPVKSTEVSGFGVLRARKPGATGDAARALRLADHKVSVRVQGRFARTEIEQTFQNDTGDTLEGVYTFPLPPGAKIAALDLVVDGKWEHGAMVDRERGEKIWAGVIRNATPREKKPVQQVEYIWVPGPWHDPALLSWKQGSEFELRIFPIPAHGARQVRLAYTEVLRPLPGGRRYRLPLAADPSGKPRAGRFTFDARIGDAAPGLALRTTPYALTERAEGERRELRTTVTDFAPTGDLLVDIPDPSPAREIGAWAYQDPTRPTDRFALLRIRPPLPPTEARTPLSVVLVVDRSYSTQRTRLDRAAELVERLVAELGPDHQVTALACAGSCERLGDGFRTATAATGQALAAAIRALEPAGATHLARMLDEAAVALRAGAAGRTGRVIYLGDGMPSMGEIEPAALAAAARRALGDARLVAVNLGGQADDLVLRAVTGGSGAYLAAEPGRTPAALAYQVATRLRGEPLRDTRLALPAGLTEVAPASLGEIWPGEEAILTARVGSDVSGPVVLTGTLAGAPWRREYAVALEPRPHAGNALLPRLWAERRIDDLERTGGPDARSEIVRLSTQHHVLSRHTSLIVLESPAMAKAFGVADTRPAVDWTAEESAKEGKSSAPADDAQDAPAASGMRAPVMAKSSRRLESLMDGMGGSADLERMERRGRRWGRYVAMRRVWYREAALRTPGGVLDADVTERLKAERRLQEQPESRERTQDLVRVLVRLGDLAAAEKLARHWVDKDRLDAGALLELAGIAALRGDLDRSRDLLASAVDIDPRSEEAQARMILLHRAAGDEASACAHALTRTLLHPEQPDPAAEAIRCGSDRERHLARLPEGKRREALRQVEQAAKARPFWDQILIQATWEGGADLDLLLVTPRGRVVTWQGGAARTRSQDVTSTVREALALSADETGRYQVYLVPRRRPGLNASGTTGSVKLSAFGQHRSFAFGASGAPVRVAELDLRWRSRLERM